MPDILGNVIVIMVIGAAAALAVRSLWKSHKSGGKCTGNCAACGRCCHDRQKNSGPNL